MVYRYKSVKLLAMPATLQSSSKLVSWLPLYTDGINLESPSPYEELFNMQLKSMNSLKLKKKGFPCLLVYIYIWHKNYIKIKTSELRLHGRGWFYKDNLSNDIRWSYMRRLFSTMKSVLYISVHIYHHQKKKRRVYTARESARPHDWAW